MIVRQYSSNYNFTRAEQVKNYSSALRVEVLVSEQPLKTNAIKNFLLTRTHADLACLYNHNMEVQVIVAQENGIRVDGDYKGKQWHGWSDGIQTWKPFRIPVNASSEPEYTDRPMNYDLDTYAEGIGMTGWDWVERISRWVAFDFDGIMGHSEKHQKKLTDVELLEVQERIVSVPWCTLRASTGGKGLHLYVFLEPVATANHNEHAALARAVLGMLGSLARFDFNAKVDACGGNMWVWHRKMKHAPNGLSLLKAQDYLLKEVPLNWKDHIDVISGSRRKIKPFFTKEDSEELPFNNLVRKSVRTPLDEEHLRFINWLKQANCSAWWDNDHWMLVTHTHHLREAHRELNLRGTFDTIATGAKSPHDHNCFLFVLRGGAWSVRRYSQGVAEAPTWEQDGQGWTRCLFNAFPDLKVAARTFGGAELASGEFAFSSVELAAKAMELLGTKVEIPTHLLSREGSLKEHKDGRVVLKINPDKDKVTPDKIIEGWGLEKKNYVKILTVRSTEQQDSDLDTCDEILRHIISSASDDCGWVIKTPEAPWRNEPLVHVKHFLQAQGFTTKDITSVIGGSIAKCWTLVNRPFKEEYPMGREWNRNACQLRYTPIKSDITFPTWLAILNHCGKSLDHTIKQNKWCQDNAILTGGDYLKCWIASVFQQPLEPLPYLFFFGEQGSGKSIFHEAITLLVTHGVVRVDQALTSNFNGELANAIICVIEETDLRRNKQAYARIKDWVTASHISIRDLYETAYMTPNSCHFVQCANDHLACPIFPGDTRITYINVLPLAFGQMIPKKQLFPLLEKEAPYFLGDLLSLELPISNDRLNLPVIVTQDKYIAVRANRSILEEFIEEKCFYIPGVKTKFSDFCDLFYQFIDANEVRNWSKIKIGRELPPQYPKGRATDHAGQFFIGNLSFDEHATAQRKLVIRGDKLEDE